MTHWCNYLLSVKGGTHKSFHVNRPIAIEVIPPCYCNFIAHRYESGSLIITSNQLFSHWDQIFPDTLMTVAAMDRIIHHATIPEIDGDSYRRIHQKKS